MFELHLLGFTVGSVVGAAVAKTEVGAAETSDDEGTSFDGCDGEGDIALDAGWVLTYLMLRRSPTWRCCFALRHL